jgi:TatD DNase family protein
MRGLFDSHAHLSMIAARGFPLAARLDELAAAGFTGLVDVGTADGDLPRRLAAWGERPTIWFSAGLWPSAEAIADRRGALERLETAMRAAPAGKLVAVGEAGLDRHWNGPRAASGGGSADLAGETELFAAQADLARRLGLPLIVHSRDAAAETAAVLADFPGLRGVVHCFAYDAAAAERFLALGFHISFAGSVTYKSAAPLRAAAAAVPADRLLIETDAPYLAPVPRRGETAEPGMVEHSYAAVAAARGADPAELAARVRRNVRDLFGI